MSAPSFPAHPTWTDTVQDLLAAPYWIAADRRSALGDHWRQMMAGCDVHLDQYESVRAWALPIYDFLYGRFMPLTPEPDSEEKWPDKAVEVLRIWINEGTRRD